MDRSADGDRLGVAVAQIAPYSRPDVAQLIVNRSRQTAAPFADQPGIRAEGSLVSADESIH
jgi:hypothetical protein